jgi:hypothetical protein
MRIDRDQWFGSGEFGSRLVALAGAPGEFFAEGRHAKIGGGSVRKNRSDARKTTARKGTKKSATARAKAHLGRSAGAGRAKERPEHAPTAADPPSVRRTKGRVAKMQSSQSAGKDPDRGGKYAPNVDVGKGYGKR